MFSILPKTGLFNSFSSDEGYNQLHHEDESDSASERNYRLSSSSTNFSKWFIPNAYPSDEFITCCAACRAGCCCIAPSIPNGEEIRNTLAAFTWSSMSTGIATGVSYAVHATVMGHIFAPIFSLLAVCTCGCCCRIVKCC